MTDNTERDVLIIGGGPAGLSGALTLSRARRTVTVVDAGEPRNATAEHMHGFLTRDGMPPALLLETGRTEVRGYGGEIVEGRVTRAEGGAEEGFVLTLADGTRLKGRRLLVTTGVTDVLPDIPGLQERWGREVQMCPYCHGWEVRDKKIVVLGTSPNSIHQASLVRQWSADVTFVAPRAPEGEDAARLDARGIPVVADEVKRAVVENDRLTGLELAGGPALPCDAVFLAPEWVAKDGPLTDLGCETGDDGFVKVDPTGRTSVPGVWAAGNVVLPAGQVIMAAAAGAMAAAMVNADLVEEEVARKIAT
ncbi:NAD(P)/FAD-dependent oxidoreductase [Actinomadura madurae]|nr:NAD(P)/FAD-dependent oxidoreductase [Actinomadura madurae]MCP9953771.1 NAD(P)/FAD-dependent oxidoreductase [Actinomadura madurae]MCP9970526.1 NAD(P)/FAD-dependent oxidoreductase [Actinomadura madurae]MCP9983000.1 NAD(P)/FAD-dependent oxidoreductase [Actinomadura madurae]MCQ0005446.1 NAD(P)/FAD-dependent oxidoreductase [Actinomadura madurae]MCQ0019240.1 NAD(P)/FAD-dependent oxidoreductase [Actinomadura madurae]